uniref:Uncharacterized protein n=1 Tax=Cajanus cajan TaxID=3821 RepID=A0A151TU39_CAJCA|nr:hypothetical protein KK1_009793 [Cajanus cajan]
MATLIGSQYYCLLFLLWFVSSVTFFMESLGHVKFLHVKIFLLGNRSMSSSLARCWSQLFTPIIHLGLYSDLPTTQMLALAFHS